MDRREEKKFAKRGTMKLNVERKKIGTVTWNENCDVERNDKKLLSSARRRTRARSLFFSKNLMISALV